MGELGDDFTEVERWIALIVWNRAISNRAVGSIVEEFSDFGFRAAESDWRVGDILTDASALQHFNLEGCLIVLSLVVLGQLGVSNEASLGESVVDVG